MTSAAITRLLLYLGAMIVVGDASLSFGATASAVKGYSPRDQLRPIVLSGWALLLIATTGLLLLQGREMELEASMSSLTMLLSTTWGRGWSMLIIAGFVGASVTVMRLPRMIRTVVALAVAIALGGLGHAAADEAFPALARVVDTLHVLSAGAWLGALALVAWMQWRSASSRLHQSWESFSRVATFAAPMVLCSGVLAGWRRLQLAPFGSGAGTPVSFSVAMPSDYGLLLGAKLALIFVMLALGYKHRRRILKEHAPSWTTVCTELALAVVVLAITGVLTGTAPPGE